MNGFGRPLAEQDSWRVEPSITVRCCIKVLSSTNWGGTKSNRIKDEELIIDYAFLIPYQLCKDHIQQKYFCL